MKLYKFQVLFLFRPRNINLMLFSIFDESRLLCKYEKSMREFFYFFSTVLFYVVLLADSCELLCRPCYSSSH